MHPFDQYPYAGGELLGIPRVGNNSARRDYGPVTFQHCGFSCSYCGQDLASRYELWLAISVDHVVPVQTQWYQSKRTWIEDGFNRVTCCRACNEFLNAYLCDEPEPNTISEFVGLRDRVFEDKRAKVTKRHSEEWEWYISRVRVQLGRND